MTLTRSRKPNHRRSRSEAWPEESRVLWELYGGGKIKGVRCERLCSPALDILQIRVVWFWWSGFYWDRRRLFDESGGCMLLSQEQSQPGLDDINTSYIRMIQVFTCTRTVLMSGIGLPTDLFRQERQDTAEVSTRCVSGGSCCNMPVLRGTSYVLLLKCIYHIPNIHVHWCGLVHPPQS